MSDLADELRPLLAALDDLEREAASIGQRGDAEASSRTAEAAKEAQRVLADASAQAEVERAQAAQHHRSRSTAHATEISRAADIEVARLVADRGARIDELVSEVLECVRRTGR